MRIYTFLLAIIAGYAGAYPAYPVAPPLARSLLWGYKRVRNEKWGVKGLVGL